MNSLFERLGEVGKLISRRYLFPLLACLGLGFALFMVAYGRRHPASPPIPHPPPIPPYQSYIAGSGTLEASDDNLVIGTPFNEIVSAVYVQVGDRVKYGERLFSLNTLTLEAQLQAAENELAIRRAERDREVTRFKLFESLVDPRAMSRDAWNDSFYARQTAQKRVEKAQSQIEIIKTRIHRSTVRAPCDGKVLQINIHVGEAANVNPFNNEALILFGAADALQMRVEIDEEDAWRFEPGQNAIAYVRGHRQLYLDLYFDYVEPFIVPKTILTGNAQERVDTRVLQVIYRCKRDDLPIYVGQVLDVYIDSSSQELEP